MTCQKASMTEEAGRELQLKGCDYLYILLRSCDDR